MYRQITASELASRIGSDRPPFVLDVRNPDEHDAWSIPTSVNIPVGELPARLGELPTNTELVVHCAADGLKTPPMVPLWRPEAITLQTIRIGFPTFGAALAGYVEATRGEDDTKNRLCAPSSFGNSLTDWATMNVLGTRNMSSLTAEPDIKDWSDRVALNPARIPPEHGGSSELEEALGRLQSHAGPGLGRLAEMSGWS